MKKLSRICVITWLLMTAIVVYEIWFVVSMWNKY